MGFYCSSGDGFPMIHVHFCLVFLFLCHGAGLIVLLTSVYQVCVTNYPWELDMASLTPPDLLAGTDPAATLAGK